ncbi:MAG: metal-dependent hydrolase [Ruminiclostridium sp.]|nr:metal-dependent hydrolase [Ruminiclostridium sp.]MCF0132679.1 metal-dependent hydrolase [Blautia sp.]
MSLIDNELGVAFFAGYLSHLLIDLFNKSPERLFYPLKKEVCFKVCYADRLGNELFFSVGVAIVTLYTLSFII